MHTSSQVMIRRSVQTAVLAAVLAVASGTGVWAQMGALPGMPGSGTNTPAQGGGLAAAAALGKNNPDKVAPALPSAVPGAKARAPVAPATKSASDMGPNEELFDAINRGDIASARDALNRGAQLDATNVLGMTPMELSVDLGRNDISFLLLSMRGEEGGGPSSRGRGQSQPISLTRPVSGGRTSVAGTKAQGSNGKSTPPSHGAASHPTVIAERPPAAPKLWANDGGAPQPSAGFLGFGR
jgi:hypothetical protein